MMCAVAIVEYSAVRGVNSNATMTEIDFLPSKRPWQDDRLWYALSSKSKWEWFERFHSDFIHPIEKIAAGRVSIMVQNWPHESGVYFLFLCEELMYVGMCRSFADRVETHYRPNRPSLKTSDWFDSVSVIYTPLEFAEAIEGYYINALNPPRNYKAGKPWPFQG